MLYDVLNIKTKKITDALRGSHGESATSGQNASVTVDNISHIPTVVNDTENFDKFVSEARSQKMNHGVVKKYSKTVIDNTTAGQIAVLDAYGRKHGLSFIVVDSIGEGDTRANGTYIGKNKIMVSLSAEGGALLPVAGHEVYHYIKKNNRIDAQTIHKFVISALKSKENFDYDKRFSNLSKTYGTEDIDTIEEEMVANAMFDILADEQIINDLAKENPSLLEKIISAIKDFIAELKNMIKALPWDEAKVLEDDIQSLQAIKAMAETALWNITEINKHRNNTSSTTETAESELKVNKSETKVKTVETESRESEENLNDNETKNTATDDGVVKYSKISTRDQISDIRTIGRKSVNDFTSGDIKKTEHWAKIMYEQLGVKSPFFRAWFGDWRAYDRTLVTVAIKKGSNRGFVKNVDTNYNINISATVFNETKNHRSKAVRNAVPYLDYIEDIVKNAILLDTFVVDNPKSENSLFMHSFYAVANIGNGNEILKLFVEEMNDPNSTDTSKRAYQLQYIKIASAASVRVQNNPSSLTNTANAIYNVANLFSVVNSEDLIFNPVDVHPSMLNIDGSPMVLYHQTENTFTVFDTKHPGAGTGDYETPFGIFMKPSDSDIGLKGKKQMQLYARIRNPLVVNTREALVRILKEDNSIRKVLTEIKETDRKYKNDVDAAIKTFTEYLAEYRKNHPGEPRKEIYNDSRFNELYYKEDRIIEEWSEKINELSLESKNNIVNYLKNEGYDSVILENDVGSFGRSTKTIIALENTQVKSVTDNIGTFDSSNDDIRFSFASRKENNSVYSENSIDNDTNVQYNKRRKKGTQYNEEETNFMQWQNSASTPVGAMKAFTRFDKKIHFYQKTEDGCIEIAEWEFNERKYGEYVEDLERAKTRVNVLSSSNGNGGRRNSKYDSVYRYSGTDTGNDFGSEGEGFQNEQSGNLERSRGDSEETSEIKLSLQETARAGETREQLIRENDNLRVANTVLKKELELTKGKTLSYNTARAIASNLVKEYSSDYDKSQLTKEIYNIFNHYDKTGDYDYLINYLATIGKRVVARSSAVDRTLYEDYEDCRKWVRNMKFTLPDAVLKQMNEEYDGKFVSKTFGRMQYVSRATHPEAPFLSQI